MADDALENQITSAERERCAKVCDVLADRLVGWEGSLNNDPSLSLEGWVIAAWRRAAARIRSGISPEELAAIPMGRKTSDE